MTVSGRPELAGYQIEEVLGRGGMGVVFQAQDNRLGRKVAIKLLAPELTSDPRLKNSLLEEARIAASLDHPNIVTIYEAADSPAGVFIAMRLMHGGDLGRLLLRGGRMDAGRAVDIVGQTADALEAAHSTGVIHGDVKPSNILLDGSESSARACLTDFGLSRAASGTTTDWRSAAGTLAYMAPEQLRGEKLDPRSDIYSLGCVLYQCLSGAPPFRGSESELIQAHLEAEPAPLADVDPQLRAVVARAVAKERADRFPSMHDMSTALRAAIGHAAAGAPAQPATTGRRRRWPVVVASIVAVAAAIAAGVAWHQSRTAASPITAKLTGARTVGYRRTALAVGEAGVFLAHRTAPSVASIDRIDESSLAASPVTTEPHPLLGLAVRGNALWVLLGRAPGQRGEMERIPLDGAPSQRTRVDAGTCQRYQIPACNPVGARPGAWLAAGTTIQGLGGHPLAVQSTFDAPSQIVDCTFRSGYLWGLTATQLLRIDPVRGTTLVIDPHDHLPAGYRLSHITADGGNVWFTASYDDPARNAVVHVAASRSPVAIDRVVHLNAAGDIVAAGGSLWASQNTSTSRVTRLDVYNGAITGPSVTVPDYVAQMGVRGNTLWLTTYSAIDQSRQLVRVAIG